MGDIPMSLVLDPSFRGSEVPAQPQSTPHPLSSGKLWSHTVTTSLGECWVILAWLSHLDTG